MLKKLTARTAPALGLLSRDLALALTRRATDSNSPPATDLRRLRLYGDGEGGWSSGARQRQTMEAVQAGGMSRLEFLVTGRSKNPLTDLHLTYRVYGTCATVVGRPGCTVTANGTAAISPYVSFRPGIPPEFSFV